MSVFQIGDKLKVAMSLFRDNRQRLVNALGENLSDSSGVLLQGGETDRHLHGFTSDCDRVFRQESYFHWTFGVTEADVYGLVLKTKTILFFPRLPDSYIIWLGKILPLEYYLKYYEVDEVFYTDEISQILNNNGITTLLTNHGLNTDSGYMVEPAKFDGIQEFTVDTSTLHPVIAECRVIKSEAEIEVIRYANNVSSDAHREVMRAMKPNMFEYQFEALFQHYCHDQGGSRHVCYCCIAASGENSATLHYGHQGNLRKILDGDMCLFDMGCEYACYCSDITCSFPANGKFTERQKQIYNAVLDANRVVLYAMKPGVSWPDMHRLSEKVILEALKEMGMVRGDVEEMVSKRVGALFMPHGLGHFLGCDTHDVHGYPSGVERIQEPGLKSLRTARKLEKGMVLTIEPGCYFIPSVLSAAFDGPLSEYLVKNKIEEFFDFGGVRIEDNVVVREDHAELLTCVPRTVEDIEALMAESPTFSQIS